MPFTIGPKNHNILPPSLKHLIEGFFSLQDWEGLYLTGGTCLAEYYFGHRLSMDMDLFTAREDIFREVITTFSVENILPGGKVEIIRSTPHLVQSMYSPHAECVPIKIDLMLEVTPHLSPPLKVGFVWIDSLEDLLANKLGCLIQRNDVKDYLDLYYLIPTSHLTTKELIIHGQKKAGGLDPLIVAEQMEFIFHSSPPEASLLGKTDWDDLKLFFRKLQKEAFDMIRPA